MTTETATYAAAVRAALADLSEGERADLLEDLEDHLAEIAAESPGPLRDRLGPPEAYAAELRSAYAAAPRVPKPRRSAGERLDLIEGQVEHLVRTRVFAHPAVAAVRRDPWPVWWAARGYLVAALIWSVTSGTHIMPWDFGDMLLLLGAIAASFWLGRQARQGRLPAGRRLLSYGLGAAAVLSAVLLVTSLDQDHYTYVPTSYDQQPPPPETFFDQIGNLYPYDKDGKPLKDILLYDQHGRPVTLHPEGQGYQVKPDSKPQPPNAYPQQLCANEITDPTQHIPSCPVPSLEDHPLPELRIGFALIRGLAGGTSASSVFKGH